MPEDQEPKRSQRIYVPPGTEELRRRKRAADREKIRLQGEHDDAELARGHDGTYRPAQNWTPYYRQLMARAAAEGRALGRGHEEDMIARMLDPGAPPLEPGYRPSPEAMALIAHEEAKAQVAAEEAEAEKPLSIEEREARLATREAEIAKREEVAAREADLAAREAIADERERALQRASDFRSPEELDDLDDLRNAAQRSRGNVTDDFTTARPGFSAHQAPPTWAGRKRMTPQERLEAEREGVEMFGDGSSSSAWSKLNHLDPVEDAPATHRRVSNDPTQRINDILAARQRDYTDDADGRAQAAADHFAAQEQVANEDKDARTAMRKEQDDYAARQAEAQATVDAFMREQRGSF